MDGSKLRAKTKAQQTAAMNKQRAIIQDMSKNIQNEILHSHNKRIEPVDLSTPTSLNVINRNRRESQGNGNDEDELKRFQKIANIYERHNYIKN